MGMDLCKFDMQIHECWLTWGGEGGVVGHGVFSVTGGVT